MSETVMGQIGEYRELNLEEQQEYLVEQLQDRGGSLIQQMEAARKEKLASEQRDTATIAGKFAEALGHIEDAAHLLGQVNEQYDPEQCVDEIRLVTRYGPYPCNPVLDFWLQTERAENLLKDILRCLRHVEPLVPKETEGER